MNRYLKLEMFISVDDDFNILKYPFDWEYRPDHEIQKYPQECYLSDVELYNYAENCVIFDGWTFNTRYGYSSDNTDTIAITHKSSPNIRLDYNTNTNTFTIVEYFNIQFDGKVIDSKIVKTTADIDMYNNSLLIPNQKYF